MNAAATAVELRERGWAPFPMPAGSKYPPPKGVTGYNGRPVPLDKLRRITDGSNLAVRATPDVVGIDVDAYHGGSRTIADLEADHGPLPATWATHSGRCDGSSIRFYRIPNGTLLRTGLPGVELIQWFHRYAMVAPSTHPEGRGYGWLDDAGEPVDLPPEVGELPDLPWTWIEALRSTSTGAGTVTVTPDEVADFFDAHTEARFPAALKGVATALERWTAEGVSRHDALVRAACWGFTEVAAGYYAATTLETVLADWWHDAFKAGDRTPDPGEFGRAIVHGVGWALAHDDEVNAKRDDLDAPATTPGEAPESPGEATEGDGDTDTSSFAPVDLGPYIDGDVELPAPDMLWRHGDNITSALIYRGHVNGFHGDSGTGKSWITLLLLAERIRLGEHVMLIDLEDTPASIIGRLRLLGITDEQISAQLVYVRPVDPFNVPAVEHLRRIVADRQITVVVIDSLGEAFGVEGISENNDDEVGPWLRNVARRLADDGPAVVLVDHITKANDRPLHASGSKRKRAAIGGASYLVEAVTAFARGETGRLRIKCAKDRHGTYRQGDHIAWCDLTTHTDGTITLELVAPAPVTKDDPIVLARRRIGEVLADAGEPVSLAMVRTLVRQSGWQGRNTIIDDALNLMVHQRECSEVRGDRGARLFAIARQESTS